MKIMIVGPGGVGGYLAAMLCRQAPEEVTLIARGEALARIRAEGLTLNTREGSFMVHPGLVTDTPFEAGVQDAIFLCTKGYGLEAATKSIAPCVGEHTLVAPLLNGVETPRRMRPHLPRCKLLEGCIYVFSQIEAPGVIRLNTKNGQVYLGFADGHSDPALDALAERMKGAEIPIHLPEDIRARTWSKYALICANAQACAYYDMAIGELRETPEAWAFLQGLLDEVIAVGKAEGVSLPETLRDDVLSNLLRQAPASLPSFCRDIRTPNKPTELSLFGGAVVEMAKAHGIPTPYNQAVVERFFDRL